MNDLPAQPKKSLGQHWLSDEKALAYITKFSGVGDNDVVLEIGPGQAALTKHLVEAASKVVAVELDDELAPKLASKLPAANLQIVHQDILKFDLKSMPKNYKVVANIPYYLTGHLLRALTNSANPPTSMTLLLQKEVAQRIAAGPGGMSILSVSIQLKYEPQLGEVIPAKLFIPPPKIDSQVIRLTKHNPAPFPKLDEKKFFRIVRAGFSAPRKKLRSNLAGGLGISKNEADDILAAAEVNGGLRAEALSLAQWHELYMQLSVRADFRSLLPRP